MRRNARCDRRKRRPDLISAQKSPAIAIAQSNGGCITGWGWGQMNRARAGGEHVAPCPEGGGGSGWRARGADRLPRPVTFTSRRYGLTGRFDHQWNVMILA